MKLDNEQQRELLLTILENAPMHGSRKQIKEANFLMDELENAISMAEIEPIEGDKE